MPGAGCSTCRWPNVASLGKRRGSASATCSTLTPSRAGTKRSIKAWLAVAAARLPSQSRSNHLRSPNRRSSLEPMNTQSAPNLKVLMVVESSGGGTGRHVLDLAEGLIARGVEVHVIYSPLRADQMFFDRLAEIDGPRTMSLPMRTCPHPQDICVVRAVRRYLRHFR